jgi:DNA-binding MarR family transcriptional regulator
MEKKYKLKNLGYLTSRLYRALDRQLLANFKSANHPITTDQYGVMVWLWEHDCVPQQALSCAIGKDKPSITRLCDNLEKRDLIERKADPNDRRVNVIHLTGKGAELKEKSLELSLKTLEDAVEGIPKKDLAITIATMKKIITKYERLD